jgi:hypothetical protein
MLASVIPRGHADSGIIFVQVVGRGYIIDRRLDGGKRFAWRQSAPIIQRIAAGRSDIDSKRLGQPDGHADALQQFLELVRGHVAKVHVKAAVLADLQAVAGFDQARLRGAGDQHGEQAFRRDGQPVAYLHEAGLFLGGQTGAGVINGRGDSLPELGIVTFFQFQTGPGDDRHQFFLHGIQPVIGDDGRRDGDRRIALGEFVVACCGLMIYTVHVIPRYRLSARRCARVCAVV